MIAACNCKHSTQRHFSRKPQTSTKVRPLFSSFSWRTISVGPCGRAAGWTTSSTSGSEPRNPSAGDSTADSALNCQRNAVFRCNVPTRWDTTQPSITLSSSAWAPRIFTTRSYHGLPVSHPPCQTDVLAAAAFISNWRAVVPLMSLGAASHLGPELARAAEQSGLRAVDSGRLFEAGVGTGKRNEAVRTGHEEADLPGLTWRENGDQEKERNNVVHISTFLNRRVGRRQNR